MENKNLLLIGAGIVGLFLLKPDLLGSGSLFGSGSDSQPTGTILGGIAGGSDSGSTVEKKAVGYTSDSNFQISPKIQADMAAYNNPYPTATPWQPAPADFGGQAYSRTVTGTPEQFQNALNALAQGPITGASLRETASLNSGLNQYNALKKSSAQNRSPDPNIMGNIGGGGGGGYSLPGISRSSYPSSITSTTTKNKAVYSGNMVPF